MAQLDDEIAEARTILPESYPDAWHVSVKGVAYKAMLDALEEAANYVAAEPGHPLEGVFNTLEQVMIEHGVSNYY